MTETSETRVTHHRRGTLVWLAITGLILSLVVAAPVFAGGIDGPDVVPSFVDGNPTCGDLLPGTTELKVEPVSEGVFTDGTLTVTIDLHDTDAGQTFDFSANIAVDGVLAKGGSQGNFYDYSGDPVTADDGLHAPVNASGKWAGLSHISFCYSAPDESESQPESVPGESESPEGSVGGGTGTPAASVPDTSTSLPGFGGPLATLIFGAILVASLGTLAYANVRAAKQRQ